MTSDFVDSCKFVQTYTKLTLEKTLDEWGYVYRFSVVDKQITNGKQIKNKKTKVTYNSMYNSKISDKVFKIYREDIELLNYNNNHLDI